MLRLRPAESRSSTTVVRTSGAADRVGSGAAFPPAARAAAISPPLIPPSRAELFTLANAASPTSFRGSEEYFGAGAADETLRMAKGSAT